MEVLQFVVLGLAVGALYALIAQGLVLIYRGSGVVNFAQGAFAMIGAFVYYRGVHEYGWPVAVAWIVALGIPAILGVATHVVVMARLRRASSLVRLVSTLGLFFLFTAVANQVWGYDADPVTSPLPHKVRFPFGARSAISEDRLYLIVIAVAVTAVLAVVFKSTRFGHITDAVAENHLAASGVGLSPDRIAAANWALGAMMAAATGIFLAPILFLNVAALAYTVLRALAAALFGRFYSFWQTLIGALAIGVIESVLGRFIEDEGLFAPITSPDGLLFGRFTSASVSRSTAFLAIVVVLFLGSRALPLRSELLDRLPALGNGRIRPWVLIPIAITAGVLVTAPDDWATALVITMTTSIVCLSIVLLTGYVGQLSLAQWGLAGFGAWAAGRLAGAQGWPFLLAVAAGVVVTIPLGVLFAVPALRTRGVNLAVLTLGLSVVIGELVIGNSALTGGFGGTRLERVTLFGLDIDGFSHPGRYGLVVLVFLTVVAVMVANLRRGRSGRRFVAVRDNERAAAALGISVYSVKLVAFGMASAVAALGGALLALRQSNVDFTLFNAFGSIAVVVYTVIGGVGFVLGGLLAGTFAAGGLGGRLFQSLGFGPNAINVVSGALLILILIGNPNGLAYEQVRLVRGMLTKIKRAPSSSPVALSEATPEIRRRGHVLEIESLTVRFGGVVAVNDVTLRVEPGTVVGLIGPNGAGKTTLIDAVTGFVTVQPGSVVRVDGVDVTASPPSHRARLGVARTFQSLELFEDLTVGDNLLVASERWSPLRAIKDLVRPGHGVLDEAASQVVRELELADVLDRHPDELPHGSRRLVAIARAVASGPSVLLLDEPAAGLNDVESRELGQLIVRLAHEWGLSVLLIEHDVSLVMATCDRIVVLDFGAKLAEGTPEQIAADPAVIAAYLGEPEPA